MKRLKPWQTVLTVIAATTLLVAALTMSASAYVSGSGSDDQQPASYMVYYPFTISTYNVDIGHTMNFAVDTLYSIGSLGDGTSSDESYISTNTPLGDFRTSFDSLTGDFVFMHEPVTDSDFIDAVGGTEMNMETQIYITDVGFDRAHGHNYGALYVYPNPEFYWGDTLTIEYSVLDGAGMVHQFTYEGEDVGSWRLEDLLESLCGDYLALYVRDLSYTVRYGFPQQYPSEYPDFLTITGNGYRRVSYEVGPTEDAHVKNGAWWGDLIGQFRTPSDSGFSDWLVTAFGGFFDTEFFGMFSIGDILLWVIGIGLIVVFIKMFAGG